ncbi:hypothetical protein CBR_g26216 [Chara braunii]|uniref:Uncharacterized protein n=1 Tax=Chara braunii TaxID=69332 RepID=A0A388L7K6_CHABU|nr:hypothetical protein CBR_g26216 [Chara braunii]|eukprot:GBG78183.1 hypothetical protein CBR_g26216 [Chara braunii]
MEAGVPESTEELHARLDREEEQLLEVLQREWPGRAVYMAEQQRARDLETGAAVPDPGGVEHRDPFAPDLAQTEGQTGAVVPDPGGVEHRDPEHGDHAVSDVVLGFRAADTLQPDDSWKNKYLSVEADDGADTVGRLSPSPGAGPGRLSHGPIGGDDMDLQTDDPEEVGGSTSLALVLWHPSSVAHDVLSKHVEGGGGANEEEEGGIPPNLQDHATADMEEGEITPGSLDPDALQREGVEDPISRGAAGSLGVGVRSPPLYTPVTPRYSGSPTSLEREQHRSESAMAAARGAHRARTTSLTPPPPTVPHSTPTPVTGGAAGRDHVATSSSPRLDTHQSFHRSWSTVRRVDERVRSDFATHQARLREDSEEHRPAPSLTTAYRILDQPGHGTRRDMLLGSRRVALAFYTYGEDGVELDRERRRMAAARTSDADTEEEPIEVARRRERERERERDWSRHRHT